MRRQLLTLVAAIGACGDNGSTQPDGQPDAPTFACTAECTPYRCNDARGRCLWLCNSVDDCAAGFACVDRACIGTACTVETAREQCGAYACVNGACVTDCALGSCATGDYCRGDTNVCMPRCMRPGDPICEGYRCDVGVGECEPYCLAGELDCAAGYRCAGDRCEVDDGAPFCGAGCGRYACIGFLGRCATHCADDADCAPEATCTSGVCG